MEPETRIIPQEMVLIVRMNEDGTLRVIRYGDDLLHEYKTDIVGEVHKELSSRAKR